MSAYVLLPREAGALAMAVWNGQRIARWITAFARRLRHRVLAYPLSRASDDHVDAALTRAKLTRADLFTPDGAIAWHRVRMAYMLAAHDLDVRRLAEEHWDELKAADFACARCMDTARCRNWLEWGGRDTAPPIFCPNARLFAALAAEQTESNAAQRADA